MIVKFHKWTTFPIKRGTALHFSFDPSGKPLIRKARRDDKHSVFAAEDIHQPLVLITGVDSPVDIKLAVNYVDKR